MVGINTRRIRFKYRYALKLDAKFDGVIPARPIRIILPGVGVRVAALRKEVWIWTGEREICTVNRETGIKRLAGQEKSGRQIKAKPDFVGQVRFGLQRQAVDRNLIWSSLVTLGTASKLVSIS